MRRTRWVSFVVIGTASAVSLTWYFISSPTDHSKKSVSKKSHGDSGDVEESGSRTIASTSTYSQSAPVCKGMEIPGRGPASATVHKAEWDEFMKLYRGIKEEYASWLGARTTVKNQAPMGWMISQIGDLKVQRPPTVGEPDLSWRGVAILSHEPSGEPIIRVGDGFLAFMKKDPKRAKFELARAMAQVWAPCAMQAAKKSLDWESIGIEGVGKGECDEAGVSEPAWAMSTAVAVEIADPGCSIPGLAGRGGA